MKNKSSKETIDIRDYRHCNGQKQATISECCLQTSLLTARYLNPQYKTDIIPQKPNSIIRLP
jgi:hypothetical protein